MPVSPNQYKKDFLATEMAAEAWKFLKQMEDSPLYATKAFYSAEQAGDISFANKHFDYLSTHPLIKPDQYLANLRLMTKL